MSDVIIVDRERVARFICERTEMDMDLLQPGYTVVGLERDGELIGGVMYEYYTGSCVEMHMAGDGGRWITRPLLRMAFRYPFIQLGCKVVRGRVPSWNLEAIKLDLKLGFRLEHVLEDADPRGAHWLMIMRREDCRFLEV